MLPNSTRCFSTTGRPGAHTQTTRPCNSRHQHHKPYLRPIRTWRNPAPRSATTTSVRKHDGHSSRPKLGNQRAAQAREDYCTTFFLLLSRLVSYTNHKITTRSTTTNTTTTPNSKGRRKSAVTPSFVKLIVKLVNYYHGNRENNTPASWPCRHTLLQPTDGHGCITSGN